MRTGYGVAKVNIVWSFVDSLSLSLSVYHKLLLFSISNVFEETVWHTEDNLDAEKIECSIYECQKGLSMSFTAAAQNKFN